MPYVVRRILGDGLDGLDGFNGFNGFNRFNGFNGFNGFDAGSLGHLPPCRELPQGPCACEGSPIASCRAAGEGDTCGATERAPIAERVRAV